MTYFCPSCNHGALGPGNCPACLRKRKIIRLRPLVQMGAVPLHAVAADTTPRIGVPGFPGIEDAMNGGFVPGSVTALYGGAGIGKSSLAIQLADRVRVVAQGEVLYCSTEQTREQIKMMGLRIGIAASPLPVAYETSLEGIDRLITERTRFVVIDSLSNLPTVDPIAVLTGRLVEMARTRGCAMILVLHETKDGDYNAPRQVEHLMDAMVRLVRTEGVSDGLDWTVTGKYRFGPINRTARLWCSPQGVPDRKSVV